MTDCIWIQSDQFDISIFVPLNLSLQNNLLDMSGAAGPSLYLSSGLQVLAFLNYLFARVAPALVLLVSGLVAPVQEPDFALTDHLALRQFDQQGTVAAGLSDNLYPALLDPSVFLIALCLPFFHLPFPLNHLSLYGLFKNNL